MKNVEKVFGKLHHPACDFMKSGELQKACNCALLVDADRIHTENLARVSSPAYKRAERAVNRAEKSTRKDVK